MKALIFLFTFSFGLSALAQGFVANTMLNAADASLASSTSQGIYIAHMSNLGFVITSAGAPVGTLTIQVSSDPVAPTTSGDPAGNVVNWASLSSPTAISSATSAAVNLQLQGYLWVRVVYTKTSGTGTITVNLGAKQ